MKNLAIFLKKLFIKFSFIFMLLVYCFASAGLIFYHPTISSNTTSAQATKYAKAKENCVLYKSNNVSDNLQQQYFYVPTSYFVTILENVTQDIYKVAYKDFVGYCKAQDLSAVSFTPSTPYLNSITFDINENSGTQVWSVPSSQLGIKLATIPADSRAIEYIAAINGEVPIGGSSNVWYYARFTPAANVTKVYEGYIYSEEVVNLTHIPTNLEAENEEVALPNLNSNLSLSSTLRIVLISLICLPFLILFVIALIKGNRKLNQKGQLAASTQAEPELTTTAISRTQPTKTLHRKPNLSALAKKQFTKKYTPEVINQEDQAIEVVFPDYTFVDDDDLL